MGRAVYAPPPPPALACCEVTFTFILKLYFSNFNMAVFELLRQNYGTRP